MSMSKSGFIGQAFNPQNVGKGLLNKDKRVTKNNKSGTLDATDDYSNDDFESMSKSVTISTSQPKKPTKLMAPNKYSNRTPIKEGSENDSKSNSKTRTAHDESEISDTDPSQSQSMSMSKKSKISSSGKANKIKGR